MRAPVGGVLIGLGFVALVAVSLSAVSYAVALVLKSEDALPRCSTCSWCR